MDKAERDKDGLATYRVYSWQPLEISLVAVPADPSVGVGRSVDSGESEPRVELKASTEETQMEDNNSVTLDASPRIEIDESQIRKAEQKRSRKLIALAVCRT